MLLHSVLDQDHNKQSSVFVEQEDMDIGPQTTESIVPTTLLLPAPKASLIPEPVVRMNTATTTTSQTAHVVVSVTPATPPTTVAKPAVIRPNQLNITSPMRPATSLVHTADTFGDVSASRRSASPGQSLSYTTLTCNELTQAHHHHQRLNHDDSSTRLTDTNQTHSHQHT